MQPRYHCNKSTCVNTETNTHVSSAMAMARGVYQLYKKKLKVYQNKAMVWQPKLVCVLISLDHPPNDLPTKPIYTHTETSRIPTNVHARDKHDKQGYHSQRVEVVALVIVLLLFNGRSGIGVGHGDIASGLNTRSYCVAHTRSSSRRHLTYAADRISLMF